MKTLKRLGKWPGSNKFREFQWKIRCMNLNSWFCHLKVIKNAPSFVWPVCFDYNWLHNIMIILESEIFNIFAIPITGINSTRFKFIEISFLQIWKFEDDHEAFNRQWGGTPFFDITSFKSINMSVNKFLIFLFQSNSIFFLWKHCSSYHEIAPMAENSKVQNFLSYSTDVILDVRVLENAVLMPGIQSRHCLYWASTVVV